MTTLINREFHFRMNRRSTGLGCRDCYVQADWRQRFEQPSEHIHIYYCFFFLCYFSRTFLIDLFCLTYCGGTGSTNLVGKFTQSVRRIVQDVKDEGPASGMTRDEVIETNERLRAVRIRLEDSYDTAKKSLVTLMNSYGDSKTHKNIFNRYPLLKIMIKVQREREQQPSNYNANSIRFVFVYFVGRHPTGNRVLDAGRHTEAGETGNRAVVRDARLFDHGEVAKVRRGCEDGRPTGRRGVRAQGSNGAA